MILRVLFLTTHYPRRKGIHDPCFLHDLAAELVKTGIKVDVLAPADKDTLLYENWDGVEIHRFRYFLPQRLQRLCYGAGIPANLKSSVLAKLQIPFFAASFMVSAWRFRNYDLIHCMWPPSGLVGAFLKRLTGKPVILTCQGYGINHMSPMGLTGLLGRWIFNGMDAIIAVNRRMLEKYSKFGVDLRRAVFIPNAGDPVMFKYVEKAENTFRVLNIASFVEKKGHIYLLDAMADVIKECPRARLVLVGDGPLRGDLEDRVKRLNIAGNVDFMGFLDHTQMPDVLAGCDVFVLSSLSEGMPLVLAEAMFVGRPAVASDVDGIPDIAVDGDTAFIVPPRDSKALAEAVKRLLADPQMMRRMGESARKRAMEGFTWAHIAARTAGVYRTVLEGGLVSPNI